ncbi:MAG: RES domain-containing protein [Spirochaetes bacterium]|nr:RES domain-containing protein [Spirochaetota bacterium]
MPSVRVVRIVHQKYARDPFSGKGGLVAPSRWAHAGQLVSYAAESLALAALEKIAGAGRMSRLTEMVYVTADITERAIFKPAITDLPAEWDRRPASTASRDFGEKWLADQTSVVLRVPSVVVPDGWNYVINVAHPDMALALTHFEDPEPLQLDPRIVERLD